MLRYLSCSGCLACGTSGLILVCFYSSQCLPIKLQRVNLFFSSTFIYQILNLPNISVSPLAPCRGSWLGRKEGCTQPRRSSVSPAALPKCHQREAWPPAPADAPCFFCSCALVPRHESDVNEGCFFPSLLNWRAALRLDGYFPLDSCPAQTVLPLNCFSKIKHFFTYFCKPHYCTH